MSVAPGGPPVAVVTGGNRGIGLEVCRQLVALGYEVVLGSRDLRGEGAASSTGGAVVTCGLDVADDESVSEPRRS